jgi:hypothetical protein
LAARPTRIIAAPGDLTEGLFGGIFLYLLELLPYLSKKGIRPQWSIASAVYGEAPDYVIIPGVLELAYEPPAGPAVDITVDQLRDAHRGYALGWGWEEISRLWFDYFRIPTRVTVPVDSLGDLSDVFGVHYRGTDKIKTSWDSNPISADEFATIVADALRNRPQFKRVFVATDSPTFVDVLRGRIGHEILHMGAGHFHFTLPPGQRFQQTDWALRDSVALSRCAEVICTSSALSSFAKVFNPKLVIHRCAASKLFVDIPYFPIAYVPIYQSGNPEVNAILSHTMVDDWTMNPKGQRFLKPFGMQPRYSPVAKVKRAVKRSIKRVIKPLLRRA